MPDVIRRASDSFGDENCVVLPDRRISFRQLEARSRQLALRFLAAGVAKGTRIGIHLPTGPEWAVVFVAATRVGALAMPLSTLYRPSELATALRIGDVSLLVSVARLVGTDNEARLESAVPALANCASDAVRDERVPYLRSIWLLGSSTRTWATQFDLDVDVPGDDELDAEFDDPFLRRVEAEVTPADQMVVIFTSGSSAEPKAVVHTHGSALRKTAPVADAALNAVFPGRVLTLMPFFWIGGMQELLSSLQSGATILTLERLDSDAAIQLGRRERATSVMGNSLTVRAMFGGVTPREAIPSIESLPRRPWEGPRSSRGDAPSMLGMTETFGPWAGVGGFEYRVVEPASGLVVDDTRTGEFLVRGYGLMDGFYKRERHEVFQPDGFYATGDLGYTEHGLVYFQARRSDMIKTRGANVAPAEVEAVLGQLPDVRLAFVFGRPHPTHGEEVVAVVVPSSDDGLDVDAVREHCRRELSPYKVPSAIELLAHDDIPFLASSKPDRSAVQRLVASRLTRPPDELDQNS